MTMPQDDWRLWRAPRMSFLLKEWVFDVGLVTAEHPINIHTIVSTMLTKLYNLMFLCHHVPTGFGLSYTVPIHMIEDCHSKELTCDDFSV